MKIQPAIALCAALFLLVGCGGGGGNPGACYASAQTCAVLGQNESPVAPAGVNPALVSSVSCADMDTLAEALAYLAAGARQLDADSDGKPCEEKFTAQN